MKSFKRQAGFTMGSVLAILAASAVTAGAIALAGYAIYKLIF